MSESVLNVVEEVPTCNMYRSCTAPITHIGEKGYVYCAGHVDLRRSVERCRRMRKWEIAHLQQGGQLCYERMTRAAFREYLAGQREASR